MKSGDRPISTWEFFPALVFLAIFAAVEAAIAVAIHFTQPADIPVTHGVVMPPGSETRIDTAAVDAYMVDNLRRSGMSGAILAIVKDDEVLHTAGYGYTSRSARVTPETPMPIASLSKSMTAAAVMRLVENGMLALDEPVRRYLPEFELADPRGSEITIRQLLNQSSGISTATLPPMPSGLPRSLTEELEWLKGARLAGDPGTLFNYSNENYHLLSLIAERVSAMSFADFLDHELFAPLGMETSRAYFSLREPMPGVDPGYELVYGALVPWDMPDEIGSGAGGVVASANDLARWLVFNTTPGQTVDGETLLSPRAMASMHTASAPGSDYGFGWRYDVLGDGTPNVHHSGIARAFTAHESLFPETGYAYSFAINGGHFFRVGAASFRYGLDALMVGRTPNTGFPFSLFGRSLDVIADQLLAVLTALALTIGVVGSARARAWARRRERASLVGIGLRLLPYVALIAGVAALPWLLSVINRGQPVALGVIFSNWPPLGVLAVASALAGFSVVVSRSLCLATVRDR